MEDMKLYNISKHAATRYAERILGKDDSAEVARFVTTHEEKIITDISKMINYGELIFSGKQYTRDGRGNMLNVYMSQTWVVLVDMKDNVITLYSVDLGCGDDLNNEYVSRMLGQINTAKEELEEIKKKNEEEATNYRGMIEENEASIKEYRSYIKNLEALNDSYKSVIDNNIVNTSIAERKVADIVNALIKKKEF